MIPAAVIESRIQPDRLYLYSQIAGSRWRVASWFTMYEYAEVTVEPDLEGRGIRSNLP